MNRRIDSVKTKKNKKKKHLQVKIVLRGANELKENSSCTMKNILSSPCHDGMPSPCLNART